jgi:endonuclease/exonuclease/phosphatase (EEP) superfamily protein YafD
VLTLFVFVGEESWLVVLGLYLPRLLLLLPALPLAWAARRGDRRVLRGLVLAGALLWLFPVAGFVLPWPAPAVQGPTLRVLSYNTTQGVDGTESLRALFLETKADVVVLQWTSHYAHDAFSGPGFEGWTVKRAGQFGIASRYPVRSFEPVGDPGGYGPPMAHAVLDTPLGPLDLLDIRPQSARTEIGAFRHMGVRDQLRALLHELRSGRASEHAKYREGQIKVIAEEAARAQGLLLIAGDSNLPDGSLLLRRYFGRYRDAFAEASWGFGWTHPAKLPWMRLDRGLLGPGLRAVRFEVLGRRNSGHRAVLFEVGRER